MVKLDLRVNPLDLTDAQAKTILLLARSSDTLIVEPRSFDLPPGYVCFRQLRADRAEIYGGIAADGAAAT